jgi:GTPase SAR1 family protein
MEQNTTPKKTPTPNMTESMRDTSTVLKILFELQNLPHGQQFMPDIPQIAIIGPQSTGKSTVLRRIIKIDILPVKPSNVTTQWTKNPIKVLMKPSPKYGFIIKSGEKVIVQDGKGGYDISHFKQIKEKMFDMFTGNSAVEKLKKVPLSEEYIELEILRPGASPICFVDIPGHVTVPEIDDKLTTKMIQKVIENKNTIILLAHSADIDLQTNTVLGILKNSKTNWMDRTIGVLTKSDVALQHKKQNFLQYSDQENKHMKLKLGWVALKNPSDETNIDFDSQLEEESKFFAQDFFSTIPKLKYGIDELVEYSGSILEKFVYDWYQTYQESGQLKNKLEEALEEKKKIGEEIPINASFFFAKIHGAMDDIMGAFETNKFQSIRIRKLCDSFHEDIKTFNIYKSKTKSIEKSINEDSGICSISTLNPSQFLKCFQEEFPTLKRKSYQLLNDIKTIAFEVIDSASKNHLGNFDDLNLRFNVEIKNYFNEEIQNLEDLIDIFLHSHSQYYNPLLENKQNHIEIADFLDKSTQSSISVGIPRLINHYLFQKILKNIGNHFGQKTVNGKQFFEATLFPLMTENKDVAKKRKQNKQNLETLQKAIKLMDELKTALNLKK